MWVVLYNFIYKYAMYLHDIRIEVFGLSSCPNTSMKSECRKWSGREEHDAFLRRLLQFDTHVCYAYNHFTTHDVVDSNISRCALREG